MAPRPKLSSAQRRHEAARRLRHDLGKYVRLSAPVAREGDIEKLRERLRLDVLTTRSGPEGVCGAVEVFEAWRSANAGLPRRGPFAEGVDRIARAIQVIAELAPMLDALSREDLGRLDEATLEVALACRALCDRAAREARDRA